MDILQILNVYKISAKEHQVVDRLIADEISVSSIFFWNYLEYVPKIKRSYQKRKWAKIVTFKISFLSAQYLLVAAGQ